MAPSAPAPTLQPLIEYREKVFSFDLTVRGAAMAACVMPEYNRHVFGEGRITCTDRYQNDCPIVTNPTGIRLYPTTASQCAINAAAEIKHIEAELLATHADAELGGSAGRLCCYYRVTACALLEENGRSVEISGLAVVEHRKTGGRENTDDGGSMTCFAPRGLTGISPFLLASFDNDLYFGQEGRVVYLSLH